MDDGNPLALGIIIVVCAVFLLWQYFTGDFDDYDDFM